MSDSSSRSSETLTNPADSGLVPSSGPSWLARLRSRLGFQEAPTIRDALEEALQAEGNGTEVFAPQERDMLLRMLRFGELRVVDVMVPRADIIAIEEDASLAELLRLFREGGHSRIPVYSDTLDDLRGMIHIKDLVGWLFEQSTSVDGDGGVKANGVTADPTKAPDPIDLAHIDLSRPLSVAKIRRSVLFVPPSMPALNLFLRMQATRNHLAMVVDEYGGTDGLISIEDLVEQIVGEIEDEHDEGDEVLVVQESAATLIASARTPVADLEQRLGVKLMDEEDEEDFDTLGGLVFALLDHVPQRGEIVSHPTGIEFEILEADPRRIKRIKIDLRGLKSTGVSA
jgi:CBS domain containing-hemolysin-like protein